MKTISDPGTYNPYHRPYIKALMAPMRVLLVLALLIVAYKSLIPGVAYINLNHSDKIAHAITYGVLAGLIGLAFPKLSLRWVLLWPMLFGGCLEIAQKLMAAGRTASWFDQIANIVGICLAILVWVIIVKVRIRSK